MAIFTLTPGVDNFSGLPGEDNFFDFTSADLQATDTITGGATGSFIDTLRITAAGTIVASQFAGVTNVEQLLLSSGGNNVTLTNGLVAGTSIGYFAVVDGTGNDTVDASGISNGIPVAFFSSGGTDIFKGGNGNDAFVVAAADLASATIVGGTGIDNLYLSTAGTVAAAAFANVSAIEGLVLSSAGNTVALTNALVASSNNGVFAVADSVGDDTVDASGVSNGIPVSFFSSGGNDTFKGGNGNNAFVFAATGLTSADTVQGGSAVDNLYLSTAGTVAAAAFTNVTAIEGLVLANGTNNVTLTDGLIAGTSIGYFAVAGSTGNDTVDASGVTNSTAIAFYGTTGGNDAFTGGNGNDSFLFAAGTLTAADTVVGGGSNDTLWMTTAGTVNTGDTAGVTGIEGVFQQSGGTFNFANGLTGPGNLAAVGSSAVDTFNGAAVTGYALTFTGNGGADALTGGSLDDTFNIPDSAFASINGNAGLDRLVLTTAAQVFDLTANAAKISNVEVVSLANSAAATLSLAAADIPQINAAGNSLYVIGGGDDQVNVADTWVLMATGQTNPNLPGFTFNQYHNNTTNSELFVADTIPISITAVANTPPTIDVDGVLNYIENGAPAAIDPTITITDTTDTHLESATVAITGGFASGQDVLGFVNTASITGVFAGNTLTLTGHATLAEYEAALESVTYENSSNDPSTATRTITFTVNDGTVDSTPDTATINVAARNDEPTLSATGLNPSFTENGSAVDLYSTVNASTVEAGQSLDQLVLTVTNVSGTTAEFLNVDGTQVELTNGNSETTATNGMTAAVSIASGTATVTISKAGGITSAAMAALVDGLSYGNTSDDPGGASRVVSITSLRDTGPNGGGNDNINSTLSIASTVAVTPVNDEPTLTATANGGGAVTFTETSLPSFAGSGPVDLFSSPNTSTVEAGQTITQVVLSVTNVADATELLTIGTTAVDLVNGNSEAVTVGGAAGTASVSIAGGAATITVTPSTTFTAAQVNALVDNLAYSNSDDTPTATTHTISVTSLTDSGSNVAPNDNVGSPSVSTVVTVVPTNDPPVANPDAVSATEAGGVANGTAGVNPSGNVITDVGPGQDTDPELNPLTVQGVALGTLAGPLSGNVGTGLHGAGAVDFGTLTITSNGSYTYAVNNANTTVQGLRTSAQTLQDIFSYTINDGQGGTSTTQVTITIQGQNDNPVAGDDLGISATEAGGTNNGTAGVNPSGNVLTNDNDVDTVANGETETVQGVASGDQGSTVISTGVGGAGIAGSFGTLTINANGSFNYVVNNANTTVQGLNVGGTLTDTFTYTMRDTAGATDNALATVTINGANDAPVAANDGSAATPAYIAFEGSPLVVNAASGIRNNDTDVDNLTSSLTATKDTNPLHGTVTVNGDGSFTYTPTAGYLGGDSFTYHVNDPDPPGPSVSLASNSATVFIDVQPRVWHIDNAFVGPGTGPLGSATNPFTSIDAFNTANAAAAAADKPDIIYLHDGTGTYTTTDGVNLFNGQTFLGQGVDLTYTTSASAPGGPQLITLANLDNTQIPVIQVTGGAGNAGITLAQNNTLAGFTIATTNADGIGIEDSNAAGVAGSVGTLNVSLVGISGVGKAIDIDQGGTLNVSLSSIASTGSNSEGIQLGGVAGSTLGGSFTVSGVTSITNADTTGIQIGTTAANASFSFGTTTVTDNAIGSGHNGNGIDLSPGLGNTNTFNFASLNVTTDAGFGLKAIGAASPNQSTITIGGSGNTINATGGAAVDLTNINLGGGGATFSTVSSANSGTTGIQVTGLTTGSLTINGGAITDAAGTDVSITGGNQNITYSGTITDDLGQLVAVNTRSGGTTTFGGTITDGNDGDGSGITVSGNTGGTVNFNGQTTLSTGANTAVNLSSNTGATINFNAAGSGLDITTTSGTGFSATGGGTVTVLDPAGGASNTIVSSSGTGLNITNTQIGSGNITFEKISSGGGANDGIILDGTGTAAGNGGLHITGAGVAGSGGTIANQTGADGSTTSGIGIYLNNTKDVQLNWMQLNDFQNFAIRGNNVTGFTFDNSVISGTNGNAAGAFDEAAISFNQLLGSASISNSNITNGFEYILKILNSSGTLNRLTVDNTDFGTNSTALGGDAFQIVASNTATVNVTVINSGFTNAREDLFNAVATQTANMDVVFRDNTLSNNHTNKVSAASNILVFSTSTGNVTYDISHNTLTTGATGSAIAVAKGVPDSGTGGTMTGTVNANTIGVSGVVGSGSQFTGIFASALGSGTHTTAITNDVIRHYNEEGIFLKANDNLTGGNSVLNATVTGNITTEPDPLAFAGLWVVAGSGSGTENNVVNVVIGNISTAAVAGSPTGSLQNDFTNGDPANSTDVFLQESGSNSVINLSRAGSAAGTAAGVVQDDNVGTPAVVASGTVNLVNTLPPTPPPVAALMAGDGQGPGGAGSLTSHELAPIVAEAIHRWAEAGIPAGHLSTLAGVKVTIEDLAVGMVAETSGSYIAIDDDAAGWGWFVDTTPGDDDEFAITHSATELAASGGEAAAHIDLLTTVMHELGHALGLDHDHANAHDVMSDTLGTGERRLPDASDVSHATVANISGSGNGGPHASGGAAIAGDGHASGASAIVPTGGVATPPVTAGAASDGALQTSSAAATLDGGHPLREAENTPGATTDGSHGDTFDFSALLSQLAATPYRAGDIGSNGDETFGALQTNSGADQQGGQHWADLPVPGGINAEDTMDAGHLPYITAQIVAHQPDWLVLG